MSLQTWSETLVSAQVDGPPLNTSATATSIIPTHAKVTIPANFWAIGKALRVTLIGRLSNIVTTPGTLTLDMRFGGTVVFNGGAMQLSTTAHTTLPFVAQWVVTCRAVGSGTSTNLMGQGWATSQCLSLTAVADSATTPATLLLPNTTPAVGSGFDSTASQAVDIFGTFSVSNAGNGITVHQYLLEAVN